MGNEIGEMIKEKQSARTIESKLGANNEKKQPKPIALQSSQRKRAVPNSTDNRNINSLNVNFNA